MTTTTQGYWPRYRARWIYTALVCGAIAVVTNKSHIGSTLDLVDLAVGALAGAVGLGSLVNLVVAAVPRRS